MFLKGNGVINIVSREKRTMKRKWLAVGIILLFIGTSNITSSAQKIGISLPMVLSQGGNHAPIRITSNDEFTSANGVTGGSGMPNDPYRIENWVIVGGNHSEEGIFIGNTSAYFIIWNCSTSFFDRDDFSGIKFVNVTNGRINDAEMLHNYNGISIYYSSNVVLVNCSCHDNYGFNACGIQILYSHHINISACECYNMRYSQLTSTPVGIDIIDTSFCMIDNSSSHDNMYEGISILAFNEEYPGRYNTIKNCQIYNNTNNGIDLNAYDKLRKKDMGHNLISNCEIYNNGHLEGVDNALAGIRLFEMHHNIIENCDIHHNGLGIDLQLSSHNIFRNCSFYDQWQPKAAGIGISIMGAEINLRFAINNTIEHCNIFGQEVGIWNSEGLKTTIHHNKIYNNTVCGILAQNFLGFSTVKIHYNNIQNNKGDPSWGWMGESGLFVYLSIADARYNWWGSPQGPSLSLIIGRMTWKIIPLRTVDNGDVVQFRRGIARLLPWLSEPVQDAGCLK
jgi:parallel beta-helix repeat protein